MPKTILSLNLKSVLLKVVIASFLLTALSSIIFSWVFLPNDENILDILGRYSTKVTPGQSFLENFIFNILNNSEIEGMAINCTALDYPNIDGSLTKYFSDSEISLCKSSKPLSLFGLFDSGDPHGFPLGFIIYGDCQLSMAGPTYYCWPTVVGYINLIIDFVFWFVFVYLIVFIKNLIFKKNKLKT
jgi:hypothetical protein